jgi:NadR type nicotinamide-nucleotide adenylyltransferase
MQLIKKVVITGPESTGKSTLCKQLAQHYNTLWVPEFAREYLEKNGMNYTFDDLLIIAKGQVALEEDYFRQAITNHQLKINKPIRHSPVFIDTDMYVMKVWCEFVFDNCHNWILNQIAAKSYDLYLLCNVDLPWVKDNLREYPDADTRIKLYNYYKDIMINQPTKYIDISGSYKERLGKAMQAVDTIIS